MSGLFGIFNFDGRPVDPLLMQRMSQALVHRGPDDSGLWLKGNVAMGDRMLRSTPESLAEVQPLEDPSGTLCLVFDGRVDNRKELRQALEGRGARLRDDTDAELVLNAYAIWGEDCPALILGDFALALWNGRRRSMFCARDIVGVKPFVYRLNNRSFAFASELHALLEDPEFSLKPNEGMIAEVLANVLTSREETLAAGVLRLPPAHSLSVAEGNIQKRQYWDIDLERRFCRRNEQEYAEQFKEVMTEAIRCRLRSSTRTGVWLSGGLDSSTVFGVANLLEPAKVPALSLIFPGLPCDESRYIRELTDKFGTPTHEAKPDMPCRSFLEEQVRRYRDLPDYPNSSAWDALMRLAATQGLRTVLTGLGGDQWFSGHLGRWARLLRRLKVPDALILVLTRVKQGIRSLFASAHPWMNPEFVRRTQLRDRIQKGRAAPAAADLAQSYLYYFLTCGWEPHALEISDRQAARHAIEGRHPFYDRRVIEFAFALPAAQQFSRGLTKVILRDGMKGILPDAIRLRQTKADFSYLFPEMLSRVGGDALFSGMALERQGWILAPKVLSMYRRMAESYKRGSEIYTHDIWPLVTIAALELWLGGAFRNSETRERRGTIAG
jgi:asparagine synthase (glutamine-hydrolysing)